MTGVVWHRLGNPGQGIWWQGQSGATWVLVGFSARPRLALIQGSWVVMVPPGRGPVAVQLPSDIPVLVRGWPHEFGLLPVNDHPTF
jgi:hypothetical protein